MTALNYCSTLATAPETAAVLTTHERIEVEELGIEILVPAAFAKMLRRQSKPLDIHVEFKPEPKSKPPLTRNQQSIIDYLKEHGVTPAEKLADEIVCGVASVKRWCGKGGVLREEYGVEPTTKGYALNASLIRRRESVNNNIDSDRNSLSFPLLTAEQQSVIEYLKEHGVTSASVLAKHAGYSVKTIQRWCKPGGELSTHGVVPTTRGYGLQSKRIDHG